MLLQKISDNTGEAYIKDVSTVTLRIPWTGVGEFTFFLLMGLRNSMLGSRGPESILIRFWKS